MPVRDPPLATPITTEKTSHHAHISGLPEGNEKKGKELGRFRRKPRSTTLPSSKIFVPFFRVQ
jgi:hypothetical protein